MILFLFFLFGQVDFPLISNLRGENIPIQENIPVIVFGNLACKNCYKELCDYFDKNKIEYNMLLNTDGDVLTKKKLINYSKQFGTPKNYYFPNSTDELSKFCKNNNIEIFPVVVIPIQKGFVIFNYEQLFSDKSLNENILNKSLKNN